MTARLFTYTIRVDDGAAPNPFNGMCSLAICKPAIRRVAKKDDWIVATGSKNACSGDLSKRLVYAMRVEEVLSIEDYDKRAIAEWPHRIPKRGSSDLAERLGDCIYDYSQGTPRQRKGVHGPENMSTDLSGEKVLLSHHFYYFGRRPIKLPEYLLDICHRTQGHKSTCNARYFEPFVTWLEGLKLDIGQLGWPDHLVDWASNASCGGCLVRRDDDEHDIEVSCSGA